LLQPTAISFRVPCKAHPGRAPQNTERFCDSLYLVYVGLGLLLCSLMMLLSACSSSSYPDGGSSSTDTTASTPIATSTTAPAVSSPTAVPATITLQVVGCPS